MLAGHSPAARLNRQGEGDSIMTKRNLAASIFVAALVAFIASSIWYGAIFGGVTLPCVITRDPRTGKRNVGMYRMQVYDSHATGMHWQRQKVAAEHYRERMRFDSCRSASRVLSI